MTDIDKAREIANLIKSGEIQFHPHYAENFTDAMKVLASAFLALDEQTRWRYPDKGKMPEVDVEVEIKMKNKKHEIGCLGEGRWLIGSTRYVAFEDTLCWRPLAD